MTTEAKPTLTMSVGRDYRTSGQYEYVIFADEEVAVRAGFYPSYSAAKRAGLKAAAKIQGE